MYTTYSSWLLDALRAEDVEKAVSAAEGMNESAGVPLHDARDLLILFAKKGDARFERAAERWLERYAQEGPGPPAAVEQEIAIAATRGLQDPATSERCEAVLRKLTGGFFREDLQPTGYGGSLADSLKEVVAAAGSGEFEAEARRWIGRFAFEETPSLKLLAWVTEDFRRLVDREASKEERETAQRHMHQLFRRLKFEA